MIDADDGRYTRRRALGFLAAAAATLSGCGDRDALPAPSSDASEVRAAPVGKRPTTDDAWRTLLDGNARFARGVARHPHADPERRDSLVDGQEPIASVISCADSRVPPEIVFDQGLGDLFTVRSAGEVLDEAVLGSLEYGVAHLSTPLLVVLGHSGCGAVRATIAAVRGTGHAEGDVAALVQAVEPAVRSLPADLDDDELLAAAVAEQARRVAQALPARSSAIRDAVKQGGSTIVAAVYDLTTGRVERKA